MIAPNRENGFALIVPVGPGATEQRRFRDLLDSLFAWESGLRLCVAIESDPPAVREVRRGFARGGCRFVSLSAPYRGRGKALEGRLSAGILLALRTVHRAGRFEFVLRADTDALVIGPFREAVRGLLSRHPDAGMVGTLGCTCRREASYFGCEKDSISDVLRALESAPAADPGAMRIREHVRLAVSHGYAGKEYCQGGVYALSCEVVARMSARGCFDHPEDWLPLAVPEDVIMGMYTRAAAMRSQDASLTGEPFANHFRGLPYSPEELVARGHALIHSVKGDPQFTEPEIRRYFRERRPAFPQDKSGAKHSTNAFPVRASEYS